jgi:hypothetical protein
MSRVGRLWSSAGLSLALLALIISSWQAQVAWGAEAKLVVYANGVERRTIGQAEVHEHIDVSPNLMANRESAGTTPRPGTSVAEAAVLAGISPKSFAPGQELVISNGNNEEVSVSQSEALEADANPFNAAIPPAYPVFYWYGPDQLAFYMPLRSVEDSEPWGSSIGTWVNGTLNVKFETVGEPLSVDESCTPTVIVVGSAVSCTAGPSEGNGLGWTYTWNFGEVQGEVSENSKHTYMTPGSYWITVTARSGEREGTSQTVEVRVEEKSETPPPTPPGPPGPGADSGTDPGLSVEPKSEHQGTGEAPPESISAGPDQGQAKQAPKRSAKPKPHQDRQRQKPYESSAIGTGGGNGGGTRGGDGTGTGSGDEGGAAVGTGAVGNDLGGFPLERTLPREAPVPRSQPEPREPKAEPAKPQHTGSGPAGQLVEGVLLDRASGSNALVEEVASGHHKSEHLQQAAAAGRGSGGSIVGPVAGGAALLLALAVGGAAEILSAGRRKGWTLGATP